MSSNRHDDNYHAPLWTKLKKVCRNSVDISLVYMIMSKCSGQKGTKTYFDQFQIPAMSRNSGSSKFFARTKFTSHTLTQLSKCGLSHWETHGTVTLLTFYFNLVLKKILKNVLMRFLTRALQFLISGLHCALKILGEIYFTALVKSIFLVFSFLCWYIAPHNSCLPSQKRTKT